MRRASPYLLPFPSDPVLALWDRKPAPRFFPLEERARRSACLLPRRVDGEDVDELSQSLMFASILWMNIKQNKEKHVWGAELPHSALQRKNEGLIVFFPSAIHCAPAGHAPRSVPLISRSGPTTAEALRRLRSRGSRMNLANGLVTGSPYLHLHSPDLALSRGRKPALQFSPLSESALICRNVSPRRFILFLYQSGSRVVEATCALRSFSVHYINLWCETRRCLRALDMWKIPLVLVSGPGPCHRIMLVMDTSLTGWGAVMSDHPARGLWSGHQLTWHINCLEMLAMFRALKHFLPDLRDHHVLMRADINQSINTFYLG